MDKGLLRVEIVLHVQINQKECFKISYYCKKIKPKSITLRDLLKLDLSHWDALGILSTNILFFTYHLKSLRIFHINQYKLIIFKKDFETEFCINFCFSVTYSLA